MPSRSKKDTDEKTNSSQILSKLKAIEDRIRAIESSLKNIEESSFLTTDDQLFFGLVFALLLFSITLPELDVGTLFASFGVKIEVTKGIITTKFSFILLLILASGARYFTTFAKEDIKRNKWRTISVSFSISSFYVLIVELLIRGLATFLLDIYVFLIFLAPLALVLTAIAFGVLVEKRWYQLYGFDQPIVSLVVGYSGLAIIITYYLAMIVGQFIPFSDILVLLLILASFLISFIISKFSLEAYKKLWASVRA